MGRALVLLSGGLDSAVALGWALHHAHDVVAVSYLYPGRPAREVRAARALAQHAGVELVEASLPFLSEPADAPHVHPEARVARAPPQGYIPARNAIFYACATYHAELHACDIIVGGHNAEDKLRFPDATPDFFSRLGALLGEGMWAPPGTASPRLVMPLHHLTKREVVALGRAMRVPLRLAWSCYEDLDAACGACPSCIERTGAAWAKA